MTNTNTTPAKFTDNTGYKRHPAEIKQAFRIIRKARGLAGAVLELNGTTENYRKSLVFPLMGMVDLDKEPASPKALAAFREIGDRYGWEITRENFQQVATDCKVLIHGAEHLVTIEDNREDPAEVERRIAEAKAERDRKDAERRAEEEAAEAADPEAYAIRNAYGAEQTKLLRAAFKRRGWNARAVSVRNSNYSMGSSFKVEILRPDIVTDVKELARLVDVATKIRRCEYSGEILSGGNRYGDWTYSEEAKTLLAEPYRAGVDKALAELQAEGVESSSLVPVEGPGEYSIGWGRTSGDRIAVWGESRHLWELSIYGGDLESAAQHAAEAIGTHAHEHGVQAEPAMPQEPQAPQEPQSPPPGAYRIETHTHTKKGRDMVLVVPEGPKTEHDVWEARTNQAKALGGWWSRRWKSTPGGWAFWADEDGQAKALRFAAEVFGEDPGPDDGETARQGAELALEVINDGGSYAEACKGTDVHQIVDRYSAGRHPEVVRKAAAVEVEEYWSEHFAESRDAPARDKLAPRATNTLADRLEAQARDKLAPRATNTRKRQAQAASARIDGERMMRAAAILRGWEAAGRPGKRPTKAEALKAATKPVEHIPNGFHPIPAEVSGDEWSHDDDRSRELRALAHPEDPAEVKRRAKAQAKERALIELRNSRTPGFFPTPEPLARRMVALAGDLSGKTVLDPSCGIGSLLEVGAEAGASCDGVEVVPKLAEFCRRFVEGAIFCEDFLALDPDEWRKSTAYDVILMNPPFEKNAAPAHIRHAYRFLNSGGVLVSVVPSNVRQYHQRGDSGARVVWEFCQWLNDLDCEWHDVEPGAFSSSLDSFRQTGVSVDLLVIRKRQG